MTHSSTLRSDPSTSLELVDVKPGLKFSLAALKDLLPDVETLLFFAKVYMLDAAQLSHLLNVVLDTPLTRALYTGDHSTELQSYLLDVQDDGSYYIPPAERGTITTDPDVPVGEVLPHIWAQLEVEVADSIKAVAAKLEGVVGRMPGKEGSMLFKSLRVMNAKRPVLGDYKATISHARQQQNLVILDVSGSMTSTTVRTIIDDVVALSYTANAHLAIVSNTCTVWEPGTFDSAAVLDHAEFGGTHYEQLAPLFDEDWGVVVTIADYDSYSDARYAIAERAGHIDQVFDLSLVNRPTFLAECVGQLADKVSPILIGNTCDVLS